MEGQIFVLIILIALNAFFAATEIAYISLNDVKIGLKAKEGNMHIHSGGGGVYGKIS